MDHQRQIIRMGAAVIVLAITLRLFGGGFFVCLLIFKTEMLSLRNTLQQCLKQRR